jgi:anti-sigma regulatory factor (Ser/Thr protein kinase)
VVVHSVAAHSTVSVCDHCGAPLDDAARVFPPRRDEPRRLRRHFVAEPQAAYAARRELEALSEDLDEQERRLLALLTTELVTNSVVHARMAEEGVVRVDVMVTDALIRVEVRDRGIGFEPAPKSKKDPLEGHWGLELVEGLADRWEVRGGTTVAFEVDRLH